MSNFIAEMQILIRKNKQLQAELDKPITEHPDVQRLIKQVLRGDFKIKELEGKLEESKKNLEVWREACGNNEKKIEELQAENERLRSVIHDVIILTEETSTKEFAEQALKGQTDD